MRIRNILFNLSLFLILIIFSFCQNKDSEISVDENNIPLYSGQSYFPKNFFQKIEGYYVENPHNRVILGSRIIKGQYDTITSNHISDILFKFKEPLLFNYKTNKEIYRLTISQSFTGYAIIIIEKKNLEYFIKWKTLSFNEELKPNKFSDFKSKKISSKDWNELTQKLQKINFWKIYPNNNLHGNDGVTYSLEGLKNGKYYAVQYWAPKRKEIEFDNLCEYIISLTDLK